MAFGISAGTLLTVGSSLGGAYLSSQASGDAADAQREGAAASDATQRYFYDTARSDQAPYRQAGYGAMDQINALLGITPRGGSGANGLSTSSPDYGALRSQLLPQFTTGGTPEMREGYNGAFPTGGMTGQTVDEAGLRAAIQARMGQSAVGGAPGATTANALQALQSQPGYQFGLNQGQTAIDRSAASRGGLYSGATLKALQRYGQDYAGTKLGETYNRLASVAGLGQTAVNGTSQAGMNAGNQISASQQGLGNAMGANALNQGNIWGNAVGQIGAYGSRNGWFSGGGGLMDPTQIPMQPGGGY